MCNSCNKKIERTCETESLALNTVNQLYLWEMGQNYIRLLNCIRGLKCTKTKLHKDTKLHIDQFR